MLDLISRFIPGLHPAQTLMPNTAEPVPGGTRKKNAARLSKDGKWRSFPRVPHLLQYVSSATHFARVKIRDKVVREGLEITVWSVAQLRLVDFLKAKDTAPVAAQKPGVRFEEAVQLFKARVRWRFKHESLQQEISPPVYLEN